MQQEKLNDLLQSLEPITLAEMDNVKLLSRIDRKYIIPLKSLEEVFDLVRNQYYILDIDGRRGFSYETTYFDTTDFRFYQDHHNHLPNRIKARTRSYLESNLHFFEVKMKTNLRTDKFREKLKSGIHELTPAQAEKIRAFYPEELPGELIPTLINAYTRITLVNKAKTERCTIDLNLSYRNPETGADEITVDDIAIIEVKQSKASLLHGIISSLRKKRIYPSSISKYVLGIIKLHPEINHQVFKPLLHKINRIKKAQAVYC